MHKFLTISVLILSVTLARADDSKPLVSGDLIAIGVNDLIAPAKEFAETHQIAPDGTVRVPTLGQLKFAGLTPPEAKNMLERQLIAKQIISKPKVRIALRANADKAPAKPEPVKPGEKVVVRVVELVQPGEDYVGTLKVNAAGEIEVPSVGRVKVEGQRPDEIEKTLAARLKGIIVAPQNAVRVDRSENWLIPAFKPAH